MLSPFVSILWLLLQAPASPADPGVRWSAPPECPDRSELLAAVEQRLGRALGDAEVALDARVDRDAARGYTLHLTLAVGDRGETREVHDPSCAALTHVAALRVLAALEAAVPPAPPPVDDPVGAEPTPAATDPAPAQPAAPVQTAQSLAPARAEGAPAEPEPPRDAPKNMSRRPGAVLRLHGGPELGAVPGLTGAVGLAIGLLWPRLRLEVQGTMLAPRTGSRPPGTVRAGLFAGAVHGCGRLGRRALEVPLCLGLELGAMRGEASRLPESRARSAWWVAAVLAPGLAWHVGERVSVWASLQLVLAPVRPTFQQGEGDPARTIFEPRVASGRLLVGVELRLRDPR